MKQGPVRRTYWGGGGERKTSMEDRPRMNHIVLLREAPSVGNVRSWVKSRGRKKSAGRLKYVAVVKKKTAT